MSAQRIGSDRCVVAVDGPSGSGKSTVSRRLALAIGARYLDTGAMYRAVTWAVLRDGVDLADAHWAAKVVAEVELSVGTDPVDRHVTVDGIDVSRAIRGPEVTAAVSAVAAIPAVRAILVAAQRQIIESVGRIVVEGRDIGGTVAPDATLKVFLTADAAERARRRSAESEASVEFVAVDLARRDGFDAARAVSPLRRADGAVVLDSTELGVDEVVDQLVAMLAGAASE